MSSAYPPLTTPNTVQPISPEAEGRHKYPPRWIVAGESNSAQAKSSMGNGEIAAIVIAVIIVILGILYFMRTRRSSMTQYA